MHHPSVSVNIYNFVRMSHVEPTRFIQDDFDTIRNQIITVKQYGFPGTYALKHDALMNEQYQRLFQTLLDEQDEVGAWWEITGELCARSGVRFRGWKAGDHYDDRVDSAYSIGYTPEERKLLVDGYMADFLSVFGRYPGSMGSWVLDSVTMAYARAQYGVKAFCICRDQIGVDGFTLWGGYPNGAYYPSKLNENIPAQSMKNQIDAPVFRLLGPDPIYNFEAEVRQDLAGVYTLEPSWVIGRDKNWINWFFACLTEEDSLGPGYAHVGQENNFLWENIAPGFAPQLDVVKKLCQDGKLQVETMTRTAERFCQKYQKTPPMTLQASSDWSGRNLNCQWYACSNYRLGLLGEEGHLRIRDLFLYGETYPSRYLRAPMKGTKSIFDALPVLFPQVWKKSLGYRPYIRLVNEQGGELSGSVTYETVDPLTAKAILTGRTRAELTMTPEGIRLQGCALHMDTLPVFSHQDGRRIRMTHEGYEYSFLVQAGRVKWKGEGFTVLPEEGTVSLLFGKPETAETVFQPEYLQNPDSFDPVTGQSFLPKGNVPAMMPQLIPGSSVFSVGSYQMVEISSREPGIIRYTLDGSPVDVQAPVYTGPIRIEEDCTLSARLYTPDGRCSDVSQADYYFCIKEMALESPTQLDGRPIFHGNGISDLLGERRASLDFIDGNWRGTLQDYDLTGILEFPQMVDSISMGFLSHHRSGIVYPQWAELWIGEDRDHLCFFRKAEFPKGPGQREIGKYDLLFPVGRRIGAFRLITHRYARMPQWCAYRGTETVFTMADKLLVKPGK